MCLADKLNISQCVLPTQGAEVTGSSEEGEEGVGHSQGAGKEQETPETGHSLRLSSFFRRKRDSSILPKQLSGRQV